MINDLLRSLGLIGNAFILLVSMLVLDRFSEITIDGAVKVSEITGLGKTTVGFLLIASITTLPELSVSVFSTMDPGSIGIAIGNVLGSNIVNICLILGLCFLLASLRSRRRSHRLVNIEPEETRNLYFSLFIASLVPLTLCYIGHASNAAGAILIALFIYNMLQLIRSRRNKAGEEGERGRAGGGGAGKYVLLTSAGALGVISSAYFIVESASFIATELGVPKVVIGATLVAFGTSLPELVNGINATRKGHVELVLGNIVGSCFINITLILGVALLGSPFRVDMVAYSSLVTFSIIANLLLWYFLSGSRVGWRESLVLLFIYALFLSTSFGAHHP